MLNLELPRVSLFFVSLGENEISKDGIFVLGVSRKAASSSTQESTCRL